MKRAARSDLLSRVQYLLLKTWLPDDFLRKVDTVSMANALECRSPLLDYRVVEFAARLPEQMKIEAGGRGKRILRLLLKRYVPEALFERSKRGFGVPWEHWCRGPLGRRLKTRWEQWENPWFRPEAAEMLFPADRLGVNFLQWTAFATLEHFQPNWNNQDA
jgi:asparagine synthase (glutamine-hydrolysing)